MNSLINQMTSRENIVMVTTQPCACGSGKIYRNCCHQYHNGKLPTDALALMRSRYAAYALNLPQYIIETTHPENPVCSKDLEEWKKGIIEFSKGTTFESLEVIGFMHGIEVAFVTFTAHLTQNNENVSFTEKSRFQKMNGKWLYHSAQIF